MLAGTTKGVITLRAGRLHLDPKKAAARVRAGLLEEIEDGEYEILGAVHIFKGEDFAFEGNFPLNMVQFVEGDQDELARQVVDAQNAAAKAADDTPPDDDETED